MIAITFATAERPSIMQTEEKWLGLARLVLCWKECCSASFSSTRPGRQVRLTRRVCGIPLVVFQASRKAIYSLPVLAGRAADLLQPHPCQDGGSGNKV